MQEYNNNEEWYLGPLSAEESKDRAMFEAARDYLKSTGMNDADAIKATSMLIEANESGCEFYTHDEESRTGSVDTVWYLSYEITFENGLWYFEVLRRGRADLAGSDLVDILRIAKKMEQQSL